MVIWYPQTPNPISGLRHATLNVASEGYISPRYRRDTRGHIAFDEGCGGSLMYDMHFTILLFFAFSLAGSELPLRYGHVHPLLWYIYLFR